MHKNTVQTMLHIFVLNLLWLLNNLDVMWAIHSVLSVDIFLFFTDYLRQHYLQMLTNTITSTQYVFTFTVLICGIGVPLYIWWKHYEPITMKPLPTIERNYPRKFVWTCIWMCNGYLVFGEGNACLASGSR